MISPLVLPGCQSFLSSASQDRGGDCIQSTKYTSQNMFLHASSRSMTSRCSLAYPFQYCIIGSWKTVVWCVKGERQVYFIWQFLFMSFEKQFFSAALSTLIFRTVKSRATSGSQHLWKPGHGHLTFAIFFRKKGLTKSLETIKLQLSYLTSLSRAFIPSL